ncbi:putative 6-phosphofructo-2-kinase [Neolecta irregularis DAH-3]|uniref:6-phosphofructo-2-kinase n=1 Tax=Neolecta irregularis (strain DAH-3) TaxID=1198029 RepID=A0A1U7LVS7_NEOID|nr:putative 6-phosphofructo-2-kinase [Neolecta irregularis DAH-3]|eukprot:OLL26780.1 putative 6-phosphofructo-2-kinase [Neolecta irregularis DAH-3]
MSRGPAMQLGFRDGPRHANLLLRKSSSSALWMDQTCTPMTSRPPSPKIGATKGTIDIPGLTRARGGRRNSDDIGSKLCIALVGLPARGKSYIVKKLDRYLRWLQHSTQIFNVGNLRRRRSCALNDHDAKFFDPHNEAARNVREELAKECLEELIHFLLYEGGTVDATNSSRSRRKMIIERIAQEPHLKSNLLFIESICTESEILEANIRLKLSGPDYHDKDPRLSLVDFRKRIEMYEQAYETIDEDKEENIQYCKLINVGKKVVAYNIQGYLSGQAVYFLLNFNLAPRMIWITRHGESEDNQEGRIGGDAVLTERGHRYAKALSRFLEQQRRDFNDRQIELRQCKSPLMFTSSPPPPLIEKSFSVWTSMMQRSIQTSEFFDESVYDVKMMRMLDEINAGICEGMTYEEIKQSYPEEFEARKQDKLNYRYPGPGGESYLDVIHRLNSVIVEVERMTDHVLLIGHRVATRILLAYFLNLDQKA